MADAVAPPHLEPLDGDSGGGRNSLLSPALDAAADDAANNFGDLLAQLLRTLPADASTLFLKSLSGLSPGESGELCAYVTQLKDEKQFRVIRAMADSTVDGKKKFLASLRKKFALQQAQQAQDEQDLEEHMKRKQALSGTCTLVEGDSICRTLTFLVCLPLSIAAARVKMLNGGAKQFHSMNAVLGAYVAVYLFRAWMEGETLMSCCVHLLQQGERRERRQRRADGCGAGGARRRQHGRLAVALVVVGEHHEGGHPRRRPAAR